LFFLSSDGGVVGLFISSGDSFSFSFILEPLLLLLLFSLLILDPFFFSSLSVSGISCSFAFSLISLSLALLSTSFLKDDPRGVSSGFFSLCVLILKKSSHERLDFIDKFLELVLK